MFLVKKISIATIGTMAIGLGSVAPVNAASLYEVTGLDFTPADINNSSQIVGGRYLWEDGNVTDIRTFAGANNSEISATSINNNGAIAGGGLTINESTTYQETIPYQAFIYDGSTISGLPREQICSEYCSYNSVVDINDSGTVVISYDNRIALVQQTNGTTTEVIFPRTLVNIAINNQDQVVGTGLYESIPLRSKMW